MPSVITEAIENITEHAAVCNGNVTSNGGYYVTEKGFCWGVSENPDTNSNKVAAGDSLGTFTSQLSGLDENVTYNVRAYALNSVGIAYGENKSFTTGCTPPSITNQPSDKGVCEGEHVTFSIIAIGSGLSYQWKKDGSNISGANNNSYIINSVSASDAANYTCYITGVCGNITSNQATLTVNTPPSITSHPSDQIINPDDNTSFNVSATGTNLTYQWQENSGSNWQNISNGGSNPAYSGANSSNLSLTNVPYSYDGYDYRCVVSGTCNPAETSNSADLVVYFFCGADITFYYNGSTVTYSTVYSAGECWLDRNLGASQVATSSTDSDAYGDLFQWGRGDDGHQNRNSGTTSTLSDSDNPGHDDFILSGSSPYDWRNPQNDNLWQGVSGINNPCPSGYRLPIETELYNERQSWSSNDAAGAYGSPLKFPVAGAQGYSNGSLYNTGSHGYYWSSTVDGTNARHLYFYSSSANMSIHYRANGKSVRCIKD
ncbi:MAG: immunoglobulin domain-containing protein [Bacteroidota bacterium]|nr:immunoglobulin domain-containing protein [Bacteroidota bacterium]